MKKKFLKAAKAALACFTVLAVSVCAVACSSVLDEEVDPVARRFSALPPIWWETVS